MHSDASLLDKLDFLHISFVYTLSGLIELFVHSSCDVCINYDALYFVMVKNELVSAVEEEEEEEVNTPFIVGGCIQHLLIAKL